MPGLLFSLVVAQLVFWKSPPYLTISINIIKKLNSNNQTQFLIFNSQLIFWIQAQQKPINPDLTPNPQTSPSKAGLRLRAALALQQLLPQLPPEALQTSLAKRVALQQGDLALEAVERIAVWTAEALLGGQN